MLALNRLTCADATVATKRVKLSEIARKIYYLCCWCDFNGSLQHYRIAKELFPSRYEELITFAKIWYVRINLAAKWPCFTVTDSPEGAKQDVHIFGPLPSRKAASDYIISLNEAFGLCRQQCLIDDPAKAASCPYYQMGSCDAPCLGKTSREVYQCRVQHAAAAAGGRRREHKEWFEATMRTLAAEMKFEEAQRIKKQLEHLSALEEDAYKWVCNMDELVLLHIDAGPKIKIKGQKKKTQVYVGFLVCGGYVRRLDDFTTEQIPQMLENVHGDALLAVSPPDQNITEQMSLVGFALYRSKPSGLWLDCRKLPTADELSKLICQTFTHQEDTKESAGQHED